MSSAVTDDEGRATAVHSPTAPTCRHWISYSMNKRFILYISKSKLLDHTKRLNKLTTVIFTELGVILREVQATVENKLKICLKLVVNKIYQINNGL